MDEAVVVDTDVWSLLFVSARGAGSVRATPWREALRGRVITVSRQTQAEVLFGARVSGWSSGRLDQLHRRLADFPSLPVTAAVVEAHAKLRAECQGRGHALAQKVHMGDAWVAATAIAYDLPLAAIDGIYREAPGLRLIGATD